MEHKLSEIDKLFNSLKDYNLPDKKGNSELMQHLLKEQQKKQLLRRRIKIASFSVLTLSSAFLITWFFLSQDNSSLQNSTSLSKNILLNSKAAKNKMSNNQIKRHKEISNDFNVFNKNQNTVASTDKNISNNFSAKSKENAEAENSIANSTVNKSYPISHSEIIIYSSNTINTSNAKSNEIAFHALGTSYFSATPQIYKYSKEQDSSIIKTSNLGNSINSAYMDFGSVITADGATMYFTSNRPVTDKEKKRNKPALEHIYISQLDTASKKWLSPTLLPPIINEEGRNNSVIGLSNDGQKMFLYRDDNGEGDIYESNLNGAEWGEPQKLPTPINSKYHESSAALSPDGRTIYFVSERPEGLGKKDIWYATQDNKGNWGNAINMKNINTPENEEGVFIHPDGKTLYFSSKGYNSLGGYDVYKSIFKDGQWSKPSNMGEPINTSGDNIFLVMEANGTTGYYTSREAGKTGVTDIYKVEITSVKVKKEYMAKLTLFKGKVIDKETQEPLGAKIEISDLAKNEIIAKSKSNSATGKFLISLPFGLNYGISVKKKGYRSFSDNINLSKDSAYKEVVKTIPLKKLKKGNSIVLRNIFFDFDKSSLRKESYSQLNELLDILNKRPGMKIEIAGYTDAEGTESYNRQLSQERAQSVVNYLTNKGIAKERLIAKGYGDTHPIARNKKPDGTDNPKGRQLNRRTEFKVLEMGSSK